MSLQLSVAELEAGCGAASDWGSYAMAHAYSPAAISRAVRAGVRSIEHGNLLDADTARLMREHGAYLVPTLVTYHAMQEQADTFKLPVYLVRKNAEVITAGLEALAIARTAGLKTGFGTDLLGELHDFQSREFSIRAEVLSPLEIIQSATTTNAELLNSSGKLGSLKAGAKGDILALAGNPLEDLSILAEPDKHLDLIVKEGAVFRDRLSD